MSDEDRLASSWIAAAPVGIAVLDRDLRFIRVNAALAAINGRAADEHIGRAWHELAAESAPHVETMLRGVIATGQSVRDLELETGDHCYLVSYFAVGAGVGAIVVEMTHKKHAQRELGAAAAEREAVLAVVSHDLRSPLQTIQASVALLAASLTTTPRLAKYLEVIRRSAARMRRLVDELVIDAQLHVGATLERAHVDIRKLVADAVELFSPVADVREVRLRVDADGAAIEVDIDRDRMLQVLGNLLDNAIRHSSRFDDVTLTVRDRGDRVIVEVVDNGPGMSAERAREVLAANLRSRTLGLYICKRIVESHGGTLEIDSELGRGTTVRVTLVKPSGGNAAAHPTRGDVA
ncbi:MAG TPA: ATP-binding protein [Kofleriaceae bacterium]